MGRKGKCCHIGALHHHRHNLSSPFKTVFRYKTARLRKTLLGPTVFAELPSPELEVAPVELSCRPGLYEPDQIGRVQGCNRGHSLASMMEVWTQTRWTERPLEIYRLGPASIVGGVIATEQALHWMDLQMPRLKDAISRVPASDETVVPNSMQGLEFFGHWLGDDCTAHEAFRNHPDIKFHAQARMERSSFFSAGFRSALERNCVDPVEKLDPAPSARVRPAQGRTLSQP
jgi:hypothetical protein